MKAFKAFCKENRIRTRMVDGELRCPSRSRRNPGYLWYTPDVGWVGITVERDTRKKLGHIVRKLVGMGAVVRQFGETEANLYCKTADMVLFAVFLKCNKTERLTGPKNDARNLSAPPPHGSF